MMLVPSTGALFASALRLRYTRGIPFYLQHEISLLLFRDDGLGIGWMLEQPGSCHQWRA